jgi:hypothetical protein
MSCVSRFHLVPEMSKVLWERAAFIAQPADSDADSVETPTPLKQTALTGVNDPGYNHRKITGGTACFSSKTEPPLQPSWLTQTETAPADMLWQRQPFSPM